MPAASLPKIDVKSYIGAIRALGGLERSVCVYCGNDNMVLGDTWICSHCESALYRSMVLPKLADNELLEHLKAVNGSMGGREHDRAVAEYEKVVAKYGDPAFLYGLGILYLWCSNGEVEMIRYDLPGFMETNYAHRKNAERMDSAARRIWHKAAVMCEKEFAAGVEDAVLSYTYFMIGIKLKDMKMARRGIELIGKHDNRFLLNYSLMVFNTELKRHWEAVRHANELLKKESFSPNAFYYIAYSMFRMGRFGDAMAVLKELDRYLKAENVEFLIREIRNASTI